MKEDRKRCDWPGNDPLMIRYHDEEWGVPLHDDQKLFEFMTLDAFQAGLSWRTILRKRENFRKAFDNFDPGIIAGYGEDKIKKLLQDEGIIRNQAKIRATVRNAQHFLEIKEEYGSFDKYLWSMVDHKPIINAYKKLSEIPASTAVSDRMSKELKNKGFTFVGTTICYAFMQAAGMVNDHLTDCFRYDELK